MFRLSVEDGVAELTLARPPVNAINEEWVLELNAKLDELGGRADWKVLHIRSDQKIFCAGADLAQVRGFMEARDGPDRMYAFVAGIQRVYTRLERLPQVTLAEIGGTALGGGFELALACDLRIAAAEAKLGLPEVGLGLIPGGGGTQRLTRICGPAVAARMILGAETVTGATARELGMVQWAVPRTDLAAEAQAIAGRIAALPAAAIVASKACIAAAATPGHGGYSDELEATYRLLSERETQDRVKAFFTGAASNPPQRQKGAL
ncbi:MAG: enoyl-CoA hydratase/isomerase family protein [Bradyrhizobiaceae bacterium]|nr:enoyl-CoA hydratase/isomerase family protein [Bradyrhizobiaceae bacterium]